MHLHAGWHSPSGHHSIVLCKLQSPNSNLNCVCMACHLRICNSWHAPIHRHVRASCTNQMPTNQHPLPAPNTISTHINKPQVP
mmetsp:Transcript_22229/g.56519  ORF Transcript_22229/g.56519 Transcript_22229/m.56519 type:complete len:83 (-) Transcript_22229:1313-1561(-)